MADKSLLDGLASIEGFIIPSTPPFANDGGRCSGSDRSSGPQRQSTEAGPTGKSASQRPIQHDQREFQAAIVQPELSGLASRLSGSSIQPVSAGPTLAFFLQLPPPLQQGFAAAASPPSQQHALHPRHRYAASAADFAVGKTAPSSNARVYAGDGLGARGGEAASFADPRAARRAVMLLAFDSPAATHAALAQLHAMALASHGRDALAALQPVVLVARVFAKAVAAGDYGGSERAAVVLRVLMANAQLPLSDDTAGLLVIPAAVQLLGGARGAAAATAAALAAAAAAADASGALSSTSLHVRLRSHPTAAAVATAAGLPTAAQHMPPHHAPPQSAGPVRSRLAAAQLLLHLSTDPTSSVLHPTGSAVGYGNRNGSGPTAGATSPGPGALRDRLIAAGAVEACSEALNAAAGGLSPVEAELQCCTLQLLAALTADVTGWPWQWPVVRAATVAGCAHQAVALMLLLDGSGLGATAAAGGGGNGAVVQFGTGSADGGCADDELLGEMVRLEAEAHAAARSIVVHLSRGPLLVREVLVQAGALSAVVEGIMTWPPPLPSPTAAAAGAARLHCSLCLGVLLSLSSLPRVRVTLASPALGPLLRHLLDLLEQQPWETGPGGAGAGGMQPDFQQATGGAAAGGPAEVRGTLLELLLNLALDPQCHAGLAAQQLEGLLVRCISAAHQVKLEPEPERLQAGQQPPSYQQPWRATAALRLVAALTADSQFSVPRSQMQRALASVGGLEVVAHEVQAAAMALSAAGAAAAYDLSITALCALMTGNEELQRRVGAMPELLTALSAVLPHPVVARSDARLRLTLAAWRLITAPLAAPNADPKTGQTLLISLGHNPDTMRPSAILGGGIGDAELSSSRSRRFFDSTRPHSRQPRQSVLLTAAELRGRLSSASGGGSSFSGPRVVLDPLRPASETGGAHLRIVHVSQVEPEPADPPALTATSTGPAVGITHPPKFWHGSGTKGTLTAVGTAALSAATAAGGGVVTPPLWTGPLLPGTPLPPPGAPPPDVSPLRLPSCVLVPSDSRPGSSKLASLLEGPLARSMSRSRSSRPPSRSIELTGQKQLQQPHRPGLKAPLGSDDDSCREESPAAVAADVFSQGLARRSVSNRLAATQPAAAAASPVPLLSRPDESSSPPSGDEPVLPGALPPSPVREEDSEGGRNSSWHRPRSSTSVAGGEVPGLMGPGHARGSGEEDTQSRTPRAAAAGHRPSSSSTAASASQSAPSGTTATTTATGVTATSAPPPLPQDTSACCNCRASSSSASSVVCAGDGRLSTTTAAAATAAATAGVAADGRGSEAAAALPGGAGAAVVLAVNPALEMSPPLLCLVTHLQALLQRPACRAIAALVLVQLSRLEVVHRSAVMGAGYGALMEAVTSSLTGLGERTAPGSHDQRPSGSGASAAAGAAAAAYGLPTDPRDKLALLEVMHVAARSALEGRDAFTTRPVLSALSDLCCGRGSLADSLLCSEEPMVHQRRGLLRRRNRHHHHHHDDRKAFGSHHRHYHHHDRYDEELELQLRQPFLTRARTLGMEIMGELLRGEWPCVVDQLKEGQVGATIAEQLLHALLMATEAAEAVTSVHSTDSGSASGLLAQEQRRQRNAAVQLLRRLASNVDCARGFLTKPPVVVTLLELLENLWDTHASSLVPAAASAMIARTVGLTAASFSGFAFSRASRPAGPPSATAAALEANGGISASNSEANLSLANRRSSNLHGDSHMRLTSSGTGTGAAGGAQPAPLSSPRARAAGGGTGPTSPLGRPAPLLASMVPSAGPSLSVDLSPATCRPATAGATPIEGPGSGMSGAGAAVLPVPAVLAQQQQQLQRSQSPSQALGRARSGGATGAGMHPPSPAPHGVRTRMSLHSAVCTDTSQWTSPAQHAMKVLELSEERQQADPTGPGLPYYRHAHTHTGGIMPLRPSPLSAGKRPCGARSGAGGLEAEPADVESDSELSGMDSFMMLKDVAPPPAKKPSQTVIMMCEGRQGLPPPPPRLRELVAAGRGGRMSEVAFAEEADGGGDDGGDAPDDRAAEELEAHNLMCNTVLRRGTRALAPPVAPGARLPGGAAAASSTGAATSATQCASELLKLLLVLAEGDPDAARAVSTLPAVELFVDLLASSNSDLVLATLALLECLARRQDAHETFWDCDAIAQLVAHLQMRSAAAAAAAAAATTAPDRDARRASCDTGVSGGVSSAGGDDSVREMDAASSAASAAAFAATVAQLQLGAARVLERLCCDPDLHGRLAATELPAALMALVKRGAEQATGQVADKAAPRPSTPTLTAASAASTAYAVGSSRAPSSSSLLSCALTALMSLLECADVRRQGRERRLALHLGILAGNGGGGDPSVMQIASLCGEKLCEAPPRA